MADEVEENNDSQDPAPVWNPFIEVEGAQSTEDSPVLDQPAASEDDPFPNLSFDGRNRENYGRHSQYETKYSRYKQAFLQSFIRSHVQEHGGNRAFTEESPYVFVDMYGGLGLYTDRDDGCACAGSPIIIYTELEEAEIPYKGIVYDWKKARADCLKSSLYHQRDRITVHETDNNCFEAGIEEAVEDTHHRYRPNAMRGLVYMDFTGCCDVAKIVKVARHCGLDLLIHHGNNPVKRCEGRGGNWDGKAITGSAISNTHRFSRRYWFTNDHRNAPCNIHQFNFLYGSNRTSESLMSVPTREFDSRFNMHDVFSIEGQDIRVRLTHTNKVLKELSNM